MSSLSPASKQKLRQGIALLVSPLCLGGCANQFFYHNLTESAQKELDEGHYAESERLYKKAVATAEQLGAKDHRLVDVLERLAGLYFFLGRYKDSRSCLERALKLREKEKPQRSFEEKFLNHEPFATDDPDQELGGQITDLSEIANCLFAEGDYDGALKLAKTMKEKCTVPLKEKRSGYPYNFSQLNYEADKLIAAVAREQGRYDEAEKIYKSFIDADESFFTDSRLKTMMNLAILYEAKGDRAAANKMLLRALLYEQNQHSRPGDLYTDITSNHIQMQPAKQVAGKTLLADALAASKAPDMEVGFSETLSLTKDASPEVLHELGKLYVWRRQFDDGEQYLERCKEMIEEQVKQAEERSKKGLDDSSSGSNSQEYSRSNRVNKLCDVLHDLARSYRLNGKEKQADELEKVAKTKKEEQEKSEKRYYGESDD